MRTHSAPACPSCGRSGPRAYAGLCDRLFRAPGVWSLRRCAPCAVLWLDPQPHVDDIGLLYDQYFTHGLDEPAESAGGLKARARAAVLAGLGYARPTSATGSILAAVGPIREALELSVMGLRRVDRGTLLDVGCGSGAFLASMRDLGWTVSGIDSDPDAARVASTRLGLDVHAGDLARAGFPDAAFDAITMHHVIEHAPDPVGLFRECRRLLRPGGSLVAVTPNAESLGHRVFRSAWRGLEPPRHLRLFSRRSLARCASDAGLRVARLHSTARRARWFWQSSVALRQAERTSRRARRRPDGAAGLVFHAAEQALAFLYTGEELVLTAGLPIRPSA